MRVENQNINSIGGNSAADSVSTAAVDSRKSAAAADQISSDVVTLSNASDLIALARNLSSPERQSKIASIAAQLRSGQYQASENEIGSAIVRSLQTSAGGVR